MNNRLENRLGLQGWIAGGRYGLERYAYTLHRITGLGILAYFLMHIFVTARRLGGPEQWDQTMEFFSNPLFRTGEFLVYLAFAFHAINGIRLLIVEQGFMLGKPGLPSYPYSHSVLRQRPLLVFVMIVAAVLVLFGGTDFYLHMR